MRPPIFTLRYTLVTLVLIILLGAFLRIDVSLHTTVINPLRADAGDYFSYAYNLRHDGVYSREKRFALPIQEKEPLPDAVRSPGYPLALMPFAGSIPSNKTVLDIILMQAALGVLMIPLVFLLAKPFLPGAWPLLPALLVALSPKLITSGTYVLTETVFTFTLLLALVSLQKQFRHSEKLVYAVLSGALLGLASLTRPTLQYFLPVVLLLIFTRLPTAMRRKQAITLTLGFLVVFTPWIIRNLITLGITTDPTLTISALLHGHYPDFMYHERPESLGYPYAFDPNAGVIGSSISSVLQEIARLFRSEPIPYLRWYLVGKPIGFLSWGDVAAAGNIFTYPTLESPYFNTPFFMFTIAVMWFSHWFWVISALITTMFIWLPFFHRPIEENSRHSLQLLACVVLYFLAVHIVGFPIARYSIPLLPVLYVLASYALFRLIGQLHRQPLDRL